MNKRCSCHGAVWCEVMWAEHRATVRRFNRVTMHTLIMRSLKAVETQDNRRESLYMYVEVRECVCMWITR